MQNPERAVEGEFRFRVDDETIAMGFIRKVLAMREHIQRLLGKGALKVLARSGAMALERKPGMRGGLYTIMHLVTRHGVACRKGIHQPHVHVVVRRRRRSLATFCWRV
jgi:hypothetical protein